MTALTAVPWVAVALSDIQAARPGPLVTAFQTIALAAGQTDPTNTIIAKCTSELLHRRRGIFRPRRHGRPSQGRSVRSTWCRPTSSTHWSRRSAG